MTNINSAAPAAIEVDMSDKKQRFDQNANRIEAYVKAVKIYINLFAERKQSNKINHKLLSSIQQHPEKLTADTLKHVLDSLSRSYISLFQSKKSQAERHITNNVRTLTSLLIELKNVYQFKTSFDGLKDITDSDHSYILRALQHVPETAADVEIAILTTLKAFQKMVGDQHLNALRTLSQRNARYKFGAYLSRTRQLIEIGKNVNKNDQMIVSRFLKIQAACLDAFDDYGKLKPEVVANKGLRNTLIKALTWNSNTFEEVKRKVNSFKNIFDQVGFDTYIMTFLINSSYPTNLLDFNGLVQENEKNLKTTPIEEQTNHSESPNSDQKLELVEEVPNDTNSEKCLEASGQLEFSDGVLPDDDESSEGFVAVFTEHESSLLEKELTDSHDTEDFTQVSEDERYEHQYQKDVERLVQTQSTDSLISDSTVLSTAVQN